MSFGLTVSLGHLVKRQQFSEEMVKEERRLNEIILDVLSGYERSKIKVFQVSQYSPLLICTFT